jgi:hypothetical protein
VGQILMEVHWVNDRGLIVPVVQALEDQGFRIFSNEANGLGVTEVRFPPHHPSSSSSSSSPSSLTQHTQHDTTTIISAGG